MPYPLKSMSIRPPHGGGRDDGALHILQAALDFQSDAIQTGDIDALAKRTVLPYRHSFLNYDTVIETWDDMVADIKAMVDICQGLGVNQFILLASDAELLSPDYLQGHLVCHMLRNAIPMMDSFLSRVVLRRVDGEWCISEMHNFISIYEFPMRVMRVPFDVPERHDAPENDARRAGMDALSIYQRHLDAHAQTVEADDFDGYCNLHIFPYNVHGETLDSTIHGPDDLRAFYEVMRRCTDGSHGDRVTRTADRAEFIGPDLICGYHVGRAFLGDKQILDDVQSRMILQRVGAEWRVQTVANSISNTAYPYSLYKPGGELKTHIEIQKRTKS